MAIGQAFHIVAVMIWVGGMFFAHMVLRPSAGPLDAAIRLPLWHRVFSRFFRWVQLSVAAILVSGFAMISLGFGGFAGATASVNAMMAAGIVMALVYGYIYFGPWQRFNRAVPAADWAAAEKAIGQIRPLVRFNLVLGLITAVLGASGRYF
ncbi:MAG: CopD family protein [Rhodomicrobium sp.]